MSDANEESKKSQINMIVGVVAVVSAIGAGAWYFAEAETPTVRAEKPKAVSITPPGSVDDKDAWRGQITSKQSETDRLIAEMKGKLDGLERQNKSLLDDQIKQAKNAGNQDPLKERLPVQLPPSGGSTPINGKTISVLNSPLKPPTSNGGNAGQATGQMILEEKQKPATREVEIINFTKPSGIVNGSVAASTPPAKIEVLGFPTDPKARQYSSGQSGKEMVNNTKVAFLPAGSFVRTAMLNGIDAPTGGQAQSNPLPVALHVLDVANLANKFKLDIKDCRFIASAWGDLSSERMMARTESLTCIINGEAMEMDVKGTIIGEDGKAGLRGRLVSKQGAVLANAVLAGVASGMGKAFNQAATVTTVGAAGISSAINGDKIAQAGLGQGVSSGAKSLEDYYLKAADKLYPIIETDGGRVVEILITKGATLNLKNGSAQARGLLKRSGGNSYGESDD